MPEIRYNSISNTVIADYRFGHESDLREQILRRDDRLHDARVAVRLESVGRDQRHVKRVPRFADKREIRELVSQCLLGRLRDHVIAGRVLHLADVRHLVLAGDEQVYLAAVGALVRIRPARPGGDLAQNARYPERALYLGYVFQAHALESETAPSISRGSVQRIRPEVLVCGPTAQELVVEQREVVDQLVQRASLFIAHCVVFSDKAAAFELSKPLCERA